MAEKKQKSDPKGSISGWMPGVPPAGILLAIACRKWSGIQDGRYLEVIADNPSVYLEAQGIDVTMKPSVTVIYGSVLIKGGATFILNEHGMPVGAYPNSILAWTKVPEDLLLNLQAAVLTDLAVGRASRRSKSSP
ncbi:MAG: hypothetical protein Q8N13_22660 [Acidovorax sp.]|nr:hypothetical protein [Acidovorax sp.]